MKIFTLAILIIQCSTLTQAFVSDSQHQPSTIHSRRKKDFPDKRFYSKAVLNKPCYKKSFASSCFYASTLSSPPEVLPVETNEYEVESNDNDISTASSYLDDGFVFGLEGSGLERPRGKEAVVVVDSDSLETEPYQVAFVTATLSSHAAFFLYSANQILSTVDSGDTASSIIEVLMIVFGSWVAADLGAGIFHWSVDNYGNGRTPVLGSTIAAFQGHHSALWTITQRGFCNNVHKLCIPFGIPTVALISAITHSPEATIFFATFCSFEIFSQEFHKYSHVKKAETPEIFNWLQDIGVAIGRVQHAQHHIAPYDGNYCIVSGLWNELLDTSGFFRKLEHIVYKCNGVEANSWKLDPKLREKTLNGNYRLK